MTSLFEKRIKQNLMQADITEAVGVNRATVSKWETGEIIPHTKKLLNKFNGCKELNPCRFLFG